MFNQPRTLDLGLTRRSANSYDCYNIIGLGRWLLRNRCLPMRVEDQQQEYGRYWFNGSTIVVCRSGEVRVEGSDKAALELLAQVERERPLMTREVGG